MLMKTKRDFLHSIGYLNYTKTYKARFIPNSSSCTTTELSKLLTSCLTTIKNHVMKYCEKVYERSGKNLFWSIKNSCKVLNKLKSRGFRASSLSTYDFSTLYTTLPHNLIKDKLVDLIERTFQREGSLYIAGPRSAIGRALTRKSGVLGSIPGLATYFRFAFCFFKKGSCQLLAKVCARSTG